MALSQEYTKGFYRTYEELKLSSDIQVGSAVAMFLSYLWGIETHILPAEQYQQERFLSYLWGIETNNHYDDYRTFTSFYRTYEELKLWDIVYSLNSHSVFIVPMRNWNPFSS